jgi:hypothetical protein
MIRDPFNGSHGHLTPPPRAGAAKGGTDKPESSPDRLEWAQARGLDALLHLLDVHERKQMPVRVHGTAEAS